MNNNKILKNHLLKKQIFKYIFQNDITSLVLRLGILYVILFITQIIFYLYNHDILGSVKFSQLSTLIRGSIVFDNISIIYINSLFIILSVLPFRFRSHKIYQKVLFWIYIISNSVTIVILNLADVIYFHFAQKRFTSEELYFFNNTNNTSILLESLSENWWMVLIAIALIAGMIFLYKKIKYYPTEIRNPFIYYPVNILLLCIVVYLSISGIRGGFRIKLRPYALSNAAYYTKTPQQANIILSNPFCVLRTIQIEALENPNYFEENELDSIYTPYHYPKSASIVPMEKPNIMIFIMESFSKEHSKFYCPDIYPNEDGFTPFLDSLMAESYVFTNAYSNGMKSIEALPSILTSIPSYKRSFILLPQSLGPTRGLPKILTEEGYSTYFFCGAERNSMGFESYAKTAGIHTFYSRNDYEAECEVNANTVEPYWGVFDMPFYQYMADKIEHIQSPFFVSVFNLTSHHPYVIPPDYAGKMPKGHTRLHQCVAYTDLSLRKLFDRFKKEPWFSNTIFVFVADHVSPEKYAAQTKTPKGSTAIFYFIYTPNKTLKGIDTVVTQQLDIMPTLLGLIGYDKPYFAFGRDVFNEPERFPMASNYVNQLYQCITDDISIYLTDKTLQSAYAFDDQMQQTNIAHQKRPEQQKAVRQFKALLQSYYNHVTAKYYLVDKMDK